MKYKVSFRKIQIWFLISSIILGMTGCANELPFPKKEMQSETYPEEEIQNTGEEAAEQSNTN